MPFLQGGGMDSLEGVRAKIVELEKRAEQADEEGDKESFRLLRQELVVLRQKEERLDSQGVWVCCRMP